MAAWSETHMGAQMPRASRHVRSHFVVAWTRETEAQRPITHDAAEGLKEEVHGRQ